MANKAEIIISAKDESRIAFESVRGSLTNLGMAGSALNSSLATLAPLLGAATFTSFLKGGIDSLDMLGDLSDRTGVAASTLAGFKLVAAQSDTSLESLGKGINKLSIYMAENTTAAAKLGLTAKDPAEAFLQLSKVLTGIESPQQRAAVANKILGKSYQDLLPALLQGEAALRKQIDAGKEYANVTPEMVKQAQDFNDNVDLLKTKASYAGIALTKDLLPSLNNIMGAMKEAADDAGTLAALWVGLGGIGDLVFNGTEKKQAKDAITNLEVDLSHLQQALKTSDTSGLIGKWIYGNKGEITAEIASIEAKIIAARDNLKSFDIPTDTPNKPTGGTNPNDFLIESKKSANDLIKEQIALINQENQLILQGVSIEDAKNIAQLKQKGITDENIVQILNLQNANKDLAAIEKARVDSYKTLQDDLYAEDVTKPAEAYKLRLEQDKNYEETRAQIRLDAAKREMDGLELKSNIDERLLKEAEQLQFNLSIQGLSSKEQQKQIALHDEELALEKEIYDLNQAGVYLDEEQLAELKAKHDELARIRGALKENNNYAKDFGMIMTSSAEEAITNWQGFGNLIKSIGKDIQKMLIRKTITDPLMEGIGGIDFGSLLNFNANGNVYSGASISAYSGSVVSKPTLFASGGNVMGEAGPEGIFPLKRGKDGKLGILASGGGSSVQVIINNNGSSTKAEAKETTDSRGNRSIEVTISDMVANEVSRVGSSMNTAMQSTFGARQALVKR